MSANASAGRLRWAAKKTVRKGLVIGGAALPRVNGCRVLTYHRFDDAERDPFAVTPASFRAQMALIAERGLALSLADIEACVRDGVDATGVLVTIDDGVQSVYRHALPVLRDYAIPAVVYLTPSLIGAGRDGGGYRGAEPYLNWDEAGQLLDAGVSVGSHAWTHRSLGGRPAAEVEYEARRSRDALRQRLGAEVDSFAYPFGTRADYSDDISRTLARCGYRTAFTSQHGRIRAGMDLLQLPRVKVEGGEGLWFFERLLSGALDPWRYLDRALWRWQARHG